MHYKNDSRIVLTLDAGGTNFAFTALQKGAPITETIVLPAEANDLEASLSSLLAGFHQLIDLIPEKPAAISFAFPGPADYPNGIIYNVGNLPAYHGGVALGPMLQDQFNLPVFINNDGDLFAYGEAIAGLLPKVNDMLQAAESPKRYQNLFAITLGTGLGGGIVSNQQLLLGDNSAAGEIWLMSNKTKSGSFAEEGASIRAVRRVYARELGIDFAAAPSPERIFDIGMGHVEGDRAAACVAYEALGEVVGDVLANALTLIDGIAVIGGGLAGAAPLFMPRLIQEMNGTICKFDGEPMHRMAQKVFDLTDETQCREFLKGDRQELAIPYTDRTFSCDSTKRIGVGVSDVGANRSVAIGAFVYALQQIDLQ